MKESPKQRKKHIDKAGKLSVSRQCELLKISRSGLYYKPVGESSYNLELMRVIDEQYLKRPWYGVPRMTVWLRRDKGCKVNHKRIERLYRLMVDIPVILTPHSGDTDPSRFLGQKDKNVTNLQFFS